MPDLTHKNWLDGLFIGDPEKIGFNPTELAKIRKEQLRIFFKQ